MDVTRIRHSGFDINVRVNTPWLDMNVATEVIDNDQYRLIELKDVGLEPKVIFDIGGHIGTFGMMAKKLWPKARLFAIEPDSENVHLYRLNVKDAEILHGAISYNKNKTYLVRSPTTTGGNILCPPQEANKYVMEGYRFYDYITHKKVELYTIEKICKQYNIETIDLAKWDCEGGEVDAFLNMTDAEAEKFRFMVGEYHIWAQENRYLKGDLFWTIKFWRKVKRKFPHLNFDYKENRLGLFMAWPKKGDNA